MNLSLGKLALNETYWDKAETIVLMYSGILS